MLEQTHCRCVDEQWLLHDSASFDVVGQLWLASPNNKLRSAKDCETTTSTQSAWWTGASGGANELAGWVLDAVDLRKPTKLNKSQYSRSKREDSRTANVHERLHLNGRQKQLASGNSLAGNPLIGVENIAFTFYVEIDAYIKAYRLSKRAILRCQMKGGSLLDDTSTLASDSLAKGPADRDDLCDSPPPAPPFPFEDLSLHLHIAKVLRTFLSKNLENEDLNVGSRHAQSTWYKHLCEEVARLETMKVTQNEGGYGEASESDPRQNIGLSGKRIRYGSRYANGFSRQPEGYGPSKAVVKLATCEFFPSINSGKQSGTSYESPRNEFRANSAKRLVRPHSARWTGLGTGSTRIAIGEKSLSKAYIGSRRPLSGSARLKELHFMRRVSDLVKECEKAQNDIRREVQAADSNAK